MMSVKMATPNLKMTVFWNKGYNVIIPVDGKTGFLRTGLGSSSIIWDWHYKLEILHQCGKRVKTKRQKVLRADFYVCRSYRGKTPPLPSILNRESS